MARPKIFLLQHLAASGGTVFSRGVSTIPGTVVLSEVHPDRNLPSKFDPIWQFASTYNLLSENDTDALHDHFLSSIQFINDICRRESRQLVIRDHFHHDFMLRRPSKTFEVLNKEFDVHRIYLARDPLDVWISWRERAWSEDLSLEAFLELWMKCWNEFSNEKTDTRVSFENFCSNPSDVILPIAQSMTRVWTEALLKNLYFRGNMTGSSGRDGGDIKPRRTQYELLAFADVRQFVESKTYESICDALGYKRFVDRDIPKIWRRALELPETPTG